MSFNKYGNWEGLDLDGYGSPKPLYRRCYEDHKPLVVGDYLIYGGSCSTPAVSDADVYIGFDYSMSHSAKAWPWQAKPTVEVYFHITDMQCPADAESFRELIEWTALQLIAGKKVHAGCIGGHGRTGTFFAALVTYMTGEKDSISYVRKNYCPKAVESKVQTTFLNKHYGITEVAGSKAWPAKALSKPKSALGSGYTSKTLTKRPSMAEPKQKSLPFSSSKATGSSTQGSARSITPVASKRDIWRVSP